MRGCGILMSVLSFAFLGVNPAFGQDSWARYEPRSLNTILEQHRQTLAETSSPDAAAFSADQFPSLATVRFTGEGRPLQREKLKFIEDYYTHFVRQPLSPNLFRQEFHFTEGDYSYWIPLQDALVADFVHEVKENDSVQIWTIWLGARKHNNEIEWVFLANGYEALK